MERCLNCERCVGGGAYWHNDDPSPPGGEGPFCDRECWAVYVGEAYPTPDPAQAGIRKP